MPRLAPLLLVLGLAACQPSSPAPAEQAAVREILWEVTGATGEVVGRDLVMTVEAVATTPGWSNLALEPVVYIQAPPDGIYDWTLYGTPPDGMVAQVLSPVTLTVTWPLAELPRAAKLHAQMGCLVVLLTQPEPAPDIPDCPVVRIAGVPLAQ
jgi:hypothetical protein